MYDYQISNKGPSPQELREKIEAAALHGPSNLRFAEVGGTAGGAIGSGDVNGCARPTIMDRLKREVVYSDEQAAKARLQSELMELLDKNRELARILELLEQLGHTSFL